MDGVGTPIIGRPRPLPGHDTPNPAYHPHTLNYEEPKIFFPYENVCRLRFGESLGDKSLFLDEIVANALLSPVWKRIHNSELCIDNILQRKAQ